jgi:putative NADH-flavin reductase
MAAMAKIVVFGAGGQSARAFIQEATPRGHQVTGVVRDPGKYADLDVPVVKGDAADADAVAELAAGHDVALSAVNVAPDGPDSFYVEVTTALLDGLARAGVGRLLLVGGAGSLEVAPGARLMDLPDFPTEFQAGAHAQALSLELLREVDTQVDWVYVSPAAYFDPAGVRTGSYRIGADQLLTNPEGDSHISYADFAIGLVDEIETPRFHRTRVTFAD